VVWVAVVFEALTMGSAGLAKYADAAMWTGLFDGWGYPQGLSYAVGAFEVTGSILLLVPVLSSYGAGLLISIMVVALGTVLLQPGQLGPGAPLMHLVLLVPIAALRWRSRWRVGRRPATSATSTAGGRGSRRGRKEGSARDRRRSGDCGS
jgi:uncharacterized membrane protein YphA (DoxX/SURF4 family)